jgi:plastocyanin
VNRHLIDHLLVDNSPVACALVLSAPGADLFARPVDEAVRVVADQPAATEIVLTEYAFAPNEPALPAGLTRLRLVNDGIRRHNLVLLVDGAEIASPEVRPGDTVEWDVPLAHAGRYLFWCGEYRHLEKGMAGALTAE